MTEWTEIERTSLDVVDLVSAREDRAEVVAELHRRDIGVQVHHVPIHHHPAYAAGARAEDLPVTEAVYAHVLSLPIFPDLTVDEQDRVVGRDRAEVRSVIRSKNAKGLSSRNGTRGR